ncbi:serine/threonine dehydratase [Streptomyces sp. SPB074]|uniref:serine/threonine dehydratase n=1 Tax=Streptomyces sp. (strain SPB074) TaxID=465543 RepID=UPI00017F2279|nr:serine/threonine dehydratase [Streptomyces sp. SPB074]EDY44916.1 pyridoxal-phosphate dependent enzyme [Streptomyces sp. SPB074]
MPSPTSLTYDDIKTARDRIAGHVRRAAVLPYAEHVSVALEFTQYTGSFKARGAWNFVAAHREAGTLPAAGVTIASGGNAGLACAWAARGAGVPATVFLPQNAPRVKVDRLAEHGARVRLVGREYAEAAASCADFAADAGALLSHAYDDALIAAGAGTLLDEVLEQVPGLDTLVVAVGGGGLFAGVATAAHHHGIRAVGVEPTHCAALSEAVRAGEVVDVVPDSVAADSLGARRAAELALTAAQHPLSTLLTVPDEAIIRTRRDLWDHHRLAVEHAAATALSPLTTGAYAPAPGERVAIILCGANTDPATLSDNR